MKMMCHADADYLKKKKKARAAVLILNKADFRAKKITRDKEDNFMMTNVSSSRGHGRPKHKCARQQSFEMHRKKPTSPGRTERKAGYSEAPRPLAAGETRTGRAGMGN